MIDKFFDFDENFTLRKETGYSVSYCDRKMINLQTKCRNNSKRQRETVTVGGITITACLCTRNSVPFIYFSEILKITQLPIQVPDNLTIPSNPLLILDSETWNSSVSTGFLWVSYP